jgi:hypothetical protein
MGALCGLGLMKEGGSMNVFNRIVVIVAILVGLSLLMLALTFPVSVIQFAQGAKEWVDIVAQGMLDRVYYTSFVIASVVVIVILLLLLWMEVRRPRSRMVRIRSKGNGDAHLSIQSVVQGLEYRIDELPGVRKVQPRIVSRGGDVEVTLQLDTSPTVNNARLAEQVAALCQQIIETQLGLKLRGRVRLSIYHEPYPQGTGPAAVAIPREPVATVGAPPIALEPLKGEQAPSQAASNEGPAAPAEPGGR